MKIYVDPDSHVRGMSPGEISAYEAGRLAAERGLPCNPILSDHQERLAFERGYNNHAGEAVDA